MTHVEKKAHKILIVDDDPDSLLTIIEMIEQHKLGYEFLQTLSGIDALRIARKEFPDLIITDWEMPDLNGIDVTRELRECPETKDIPVIFCTGRMTTSENLKKAFESGAVDFIRKPIDELELVARIRSMLLLVDTFKKSKEQLKQLLIKEKEIERQKNINLTNELQFKNKEIISKAMFLSQNSGLFKEITGQLDQLSSLLEDDKAIKKIRSIKNLIKQEDVTNFSTEFEEKFSEINDTFYKRLNLKHPGLTPNDMKLCAFLRLNLSTKEICAVTFQTPNAIDVARHRLRKKLGLGLSDNLVAELKKI